jgi:hypothetical protein
MNKRTIYLFVIFTSIIVSSPFVISDFIGLSSLLLVAPLLIIAAIVVFASYRKIKLEKSTFRLFYVQFSLVVILFIYHKLFTENVINYHLIAINMLGVYLCYLIIDNLIGKERFIDLYLKAFNFLCIISFISFFLVVFSILEPISEFINPDGRTNYNFGLTFSNSYNPLTSFIRVGSFFDEPGTFAYIIMLNLLLNKLTFNNRKTEIIHIICGMVTFSLAHFATVILYIVFFYGVKGFSISFNYVTPIAVLVVLIGFINPYILNLIERATINRIQYDEEQVISGSNRLILTQIAYNAFLEKPLLGHGIVTNDPSSNYYNIYIGANIFQPFAYHGVIGFLILFLHFLYFGYISLKKYLTRRRFNLLVPWLILFANFFQRPTVFGGILIYLMLLLFISLINEK